MALKRGVFCLTLGLLLSGRIALAATTERVSVSSAGEQGDNRSADWPAISADGRYVAFRSSARNLVPGDTNHHADIFVRDRVLGVTERVSVSSAGEQADAYCMSPAISADGRFVAFPSWASNLTPGDTNGASDVFVRDRVLGVTERVSVSTDGEEGNARSEYPSLSADGRFVAFFSSASNLAPGDTNGVEDVFVRDRVSGTTERVSVSTVGEQGNDGSWFPSMSADGRFVAFESFASNLAPGDTNGWLDIFVRDRVLGTTDRVSLSSAEEQADGESGWSAIEGDGRYVTFTSLASNLVPDDTNDAYDVFVRDRLTETTERVSVGSAGEQGEGDSAWSAISADGRYVAFASLAANLVAGDTNGITDIFVRDRVSGTTERASVSSAGEQADGDSAWPVISADGGHVAFPSLAANLVPDDTNGVEDIFVRDRGGAPAPSMSSTSFESRGSPWATSSAGPLRGDTWRRPLTGTLAAHSGLYAMSPEVEGEGITGLRLALPAEPTGAVGVAVRAWAYVGERTEGDSSTFFGFALDEEYPSAAAGWGEMLGWEALSDSASQFQLAGEQQPTAAGLAEGGWGLVQLGYVRATNALTLWLNGEEVGTVEAPGAAGQAPRYVVLGALGEGSGARHHVYFDDVQVTLVGYAPSEDQSFALLEGPEQAVQGQERTLTLQYGNGYPMLGMEEITETLPETMYVGVSLPAGYSVVGAEPAPSRVTGGTAVWELAMPAIGQGGYIHLRAQTPTGLVEPAEDRIWAWATSDAGAASADPPNPPDWSSPWGGAWGWPQDVLPQHVDLGPQPDVWVRKRGPRFASPGDAINYAITAGNCGNAAASEVVVRDQMPELLGGGDQILANLAELEVGETWSGVVSGVLPWGVPESALLLNTAYAPTAALEVVGENNTSQWQTTTQAARDPNQITVSPTGGVDRGQTLTYTVECENVGAGTAYGVYATVDLDRKLDWRTVLVADPGEVSFDRVSRALVWEVGPLGPGEGASTSFTVMVAEDARRARSIIGQATVYFPSVPEETPTNIVVNVVNGSFPDVPWDHWAVGEIESTFEAGIVQGYPNGQYRPTVAVTRDQMAVFVARAMAGGDENVPTGPATATFPDVPTDHWAYEYIEYAVDHEVVEGYPNGTYRPANEVDRGQMAVYMARALAGGESNVPPAMPPATFPDVAPGTDWEWCWSHVEYIATKGIAGGYEDGTYRPQYTCTRDQMAVYVTRGFRLPM